jgi:hypothetical protein
MATKAGVWIDHKQAIVVLISDSGQEVKKIAFDIGQPVYTPGSKRSKSSYGRSDFTAEDRIERKVASDRKDYYADVLATLHGASAVLILGPGEAKGELSKQIKAKKVRGLAVEVETADKMTDRQLAAKVSEHFAPATVRKPKAPNKSKKSAPTKPVTRAKKAAK